ncbi:MAG: HAD family hydrolase [Clostridia bacterium]|nr:HAD family hydrolase [Clostridia bacterium]
MSIYLFDFDGTLVDSMDTYVGVMLSILDKNAIKYEKDIVKIITPLGYIGTAKYFNELGVPGAVDELVKEMRENMVYEYTNNICEKPNVIMTIKALYKRGDSLNVLTASPHATLDPCLKRLGLFDLFDNVWSCDDFNTTKADPEIYKMAAEKIGAGVKHIIFLDDNFNALTTAKSAGMSVYGVYDKSSDEYTEDIKAISDRYISDFKELI